MSSLLWFMFGLWLGGTVGFLLFAFLQMSRDAARMADSQWSKLDRGHRPTTVISGTASRRPRFREGEVGC